MEKALVLDNFNTYFCVRYLASFNVIYFAMLLINKFGTKNVPKFI